MSNAVFPEDSLPTYDPNPEGEDVDLEAALEEGAESEDDPEDEQDPPDV